MSNHDFSARRKSIRFTKKQGKFGLTDQLIIRGKSLTKVVIAYITIRKLFIVEGH